MRPECLPFSQIPHTTRLFSDFISHYPKVQKFYPRSPHFAEWMKNAPVDYDRPRREQVAAILEGQNRSWDASPRTMENIARLRSGASALVTGQQVGLLGGPLFSLFKALTAVKLADLAARSGRECVPVFWLATEDHDLAEVNQVSIPGPDAVLQPFTAPTDAIADAPVAAVKFGAEFQSVVDQAVGLLGASEISDFIRQAYRPGESFGVAFAQLFARLIADWGVILLDASDPELHRVAEPVYRAAIEHATQLDDALLARGKELEDAGYHQQVKVTPSSTLLFTLRNGARVPVHHRSNGPTANKEAEFLIAEEKISRSELLSRIAAAPQNVSPNVLLRPVVQDYLLPTLAYTGGSAEVAYFAQVAVVYEQILGRITPIIPRFSATIVEPKPKGLLERYGLSLPDLFHGPELLREQLAAHTLPKELQSAFDEAQASVEKSLASIRDGLARLDKTLVDSADHAASKMRHQLESLRARAARAELRQSEILGRHAELLSNALYPNKALQEREVAGVYFLARYGPRFLHDLYENLNAECLDHQVISM